MLSIEKALVREIPNIHERVIEKFISDKNRGIDLKNTCTKCTKTTIPCLTLFSVFLKIF